jgi:hypothetical protein
MVKRILFVCFENSCCSQMNVRAQIKDKVKELLTEDTSHNSLINNELRL